MANLSQALKQLRRERKRVADELQRLDEAISVLGRLDGRGGVGRRQTRAPRARRRLSVAARRRIAQAQKARWAKWKAKQSKSAG